MTPSLVASGYLILSVPFLSYWWPRAVRALKRPDFGYLRVWPMYLFLGTFQLVQHCLASSGTTVEWFGADVNIGSSLLFPLSLGSLLFLYMASSPREFAKVTSFLVLVNAVMAGVISLIRGGYLPWLAFPDQPAIWAPGASVKIVLGTLLLVVDALVMIACYRILARLTDLVGIRVFVALTVALAVDSVGFSGVLWWFDGGDYGSRVGNQFASKISSGAVYTLCIVMSGYLGSIQWATLPVVPFWKFLCGVGLFFAVLPPTVWAWFDRLTLHRVPEKAISRDKQLWRKPSRNELCDYQEDVRMKELLDGVPPEISPAQIRMGREWQKLLTEHLDQWVAYTDQGLIACEPTSKELYAKLTQLGISLDDCVLRKVVPWITVDEKTGAEVTTFWGVGPTSN